MRSQKTRRNLTREELLRAACSELGKVQTGEAESSGRESAGFAV